MFISLWLNLALWKQCPPTFNSLYIYLFYVFGNLKQEAHIDRKTSISWLSAILYTELSFLLPYTTSLSTLILQAFVKFRNSSKIVLKIVLIIVNINKNENKSLISNQFSLQIDFTPPPTSWRTTLRRQKLKS